MYIEKSNYKFHPKYTTEEKEKIALLYINQEIGIYSNCKKNLIWLIIIYYIAGLNNIKNLVKYLKQEEKLQNLIILIKAVLESFQKNL